MLKHTGILTVLAALAVCADAGVAPNDVDAVGSHGQTVCHVTDAGERATLQIAEPSVIAERTGITTVADFRPRDIAAGGSGAPLVPVAVAFMAVTQEELPLLPRDQEDKGQPGPQRNAGTASSLTHGCSSSGARPSVIRRRSASER